MDEEMMILMRDINPHIVCSLCAGYFIDATTVMECLHTFCRSCIVKYLQSSKHCPQCNIKIHETQPLSNLKPDNTMQDIVYKLVPGLYENEERRRQQFFKAQGLSKEQKLDENKLPGLGNIYDSPTAHYYSNDEQICFCLEKFSPEYNGYPLWSLPKKFVRCSIRVCIYYLQQLVRKSFSIPKSHQVEILCNNTLLKKEMTLKIVYLSKWQNRPSLMMLYYRVVPG